MADSYWNDYIDRQTATASPTPASGDTDISTYNNPNLPMWQRVGLQAPPSDSQTPPLNGPQPPMNIAPQQPNVPMQSPQGAPQTPQAPQSPFQFTMGGQQGQQPQSAPPTMQPISGPIRPQINPMHMQAIAALLQRYRSLGV